MWQPLSLNFLTPCVITLFTHLTSWEGDAHVILNMVAFTLMFELYANPPTTLQVLGPGKGLWLVGTTIPWPWTRWWSLYHQLAMNSMYRSQNAPLTATKKSYACLPDVSDTPFDPGEPMYDPPALKHLLHHHPPFKASPQSAIKDMICRNRYNNHHASDPHLSSIHEKSANNTQKSYSIALPRWTLCFVIGIFLSALG